MRSVVYAAAELALAADFEAEEGIPESSIPEWFANACGEDNARKDYLSQVGAERYMNQQGERPWDLQDWLYCFDPARRSWSWWAITSGEDTTVEIWVDTAGEPFFAYDELRWLAFVSGCESFNAPELHSDGEWTRVAPNEVPARRNGPSL